MSSTREVAAGGGIAAKTTLPSVRDRIISEREEKRTVWQRFNTLSTKTYTWKRLMDLMLGSFGVVLFFLLSPLIALGIKLSSRGPVIFKQERTGQLGKTFTCYKFRTMHRLDLRRIDGKPVVTQKGDKRIFVFGNFLRKTNLDELPQIINVLKGNMSLVGPRPYPVEECTHWNNIFDDFFYRYSVKPGLTGHAQTSGYRGGTLDEEHMRRRLDKDLVYVEKQSLWLDLKIVIKTVLQMLRLQTDAH